MRSTFLTVIIFSLFFLVTSIQALDVTLPVQFPPTQPSPTATPNPSPTPDSENPQVTPTASPTPSVSPAPEASPTPQASPTPSASPRPSPIVSPTPTPIVVIVSPRPTATPTPAPSPESNIGGVNDEETDEEEIENEEDDDEASASGVIEDSDPITPILSAIENIIEEVEGEPLTLPELVSELEVPLNQFKQLFTDQVYYSPDKAHPVLNFLLGLGSMSLISSGLFLLHPKGAIWFRQLISQNESWQRINNHWPHLLEN